MNRFNIAGGVNYKEVFLLPGQFQESFADLLVVAVAFLLLSMTSCNLPLAEDEEGDYDRAPPTLDAAPKDGPLPAQDDAPPPAPEDTSLLRDFALPVPLFTPDSAWNQRADGAAVLPESEAQILSLFRVLLGDISTLRGYDKPATEWPYMDISLYDYTIPIYRAGDGEQEVVICEDEGVLGWPHPKFGIETEGGPVTVPAPVGTVRSSGPEDGDADGHLVLYAPQTFTEYDYFSATLDGKGDCAGFQGGMVGRQITEAGVVDYFDVRDQGANPDGNYSARAVGTPLLAGLILHGLVAGSFSEVVRLFGDHAGGRSEEHTTELQSH